MVTRTTPNRLGDGCLRVVPAGRSGQSLCPERGNCQKKGDQRECPDTNGSLQGRNGVCAFHSLSLISSSAAERTAVHGDKYGRAGGVFRAAHRPVAG